MRATFLAFAALAIMVWVGIAVGANMRTPGIVGLAATIIGGLCASVLTIAVGGAVALKLGEGDYTSVAPRGGTETPVSELAPALAELDFLQRPVQRRMVERAGWRVPLGAAAGIGLWSLVVWLGAPGGVVDFSAVMIGGGLAGYAWAHVQAARENAAIYSQRAVDVLASGLGPLNWRNSATVDNARLRAAGIVPGFAALKTTGEIVGAHAGRSLRVTPVETVPPHGVDKANAFKGLLVEIETPELAGATGGLGALPSAASALIEQLATLPHLGRPKTALADGRLLMAIPETGSPRVFDPPQEPGSRAAAPALARVRQALGAVLHVAGALSGPAQG